jgi:hypothetical protein
VPLKIPFPTAIEPFSVNACDPLNGEGTTTTVAVPDDTGSAGAAALATPASLSWAIDAAEITATAVENAFRLQPRIPAPFAPIDRF